MPEGNIPPDKFAHNGAEAAVVWAFASLCFFFAGCVSSFVHLGSRSAYHSSSTNPLKHSSATGCPFLGSGHLQGVYTIRIMSAIV